MWPGGSRQAIGAVETVLAQAGQLVTRGGLRMPQVTVTIAGHTYRIACAEGEEAHLEGLAAAYDARVEEMRGTFGEIGDLRLHVMAAITQADELHETRQRIAALEAEVAASTASTPPGTSASSGSRRGSPRASRWPPSGSRTWRAA